MLSELTTPKAKITASTDARVHPLPWCSCGCTGARAKPVQPRAAQGPASRPGSLWLPTPVPAAALAPPDTHPCPLLVLLMLLGATTKLVLQAAIPGKAIRYFGQAGRAPRSAHCAKPLSGTRGGLSRFAQDCSVEMSLKVSGQLTEVQPLLWGAGSGVPAVSGDR